jgi:predicted  nucleic acid-binding Zn-ribbon protein
LPLQVDQERKGERHAVELVKFNDLEEKIKNIIEEYTVLKRRNQELEESLKNRDAEQEDLKNTIRKLNEERDAVRTKVDSLLVMLQNIQM